MTSAAVGLALGVALLAAAGLGARAGDIVWSEPAGFALQGTVVCFGIVCEVVGVLAGTAYPIELLYQLTDSAPVPAIELGVWPRGAGALERALVLAVALALALRRIA